MKTPMMMIIQNIIDIESKTYNQEQLYMLSALKIGALVLLEEEKEHIIAAANFLPHDEQNEIKTPEEYYNDKYKTK